MITFTDTGIGFDNKYASDIFSVFKRMHDIQEYQGSGIGLSICKRIIENHNGFIEATGEEGKGTSVSLYFPVYHDAETKKPEPIGRTGFFLKKMM